MEMIPELRYILGSSLIRVCKEYKTGLLVLDLASEESLYQSPQQMLTLKDRLPSEGEQVMELF